MSTNDDLICRYLTKYLLNNTNENRTKKHCVVSVVSFTQLRALTI